MRRFVADTQCVLWYLARDRLDVAVARAVADFGLSAVPELADRIIAATARALNLPLLTTDPAIAASGLVKVAK